MHGRVKVRTSQEEKARKQKERQEKLKLFQYAMQKIQSKRQNKELDKQLLEITGQVLQSNPDIYTLWNIRRETLLLLNTDEKKEDISSLFDAELQLTEYCLKINPKSYCAWHQREWVLTTRTDPDWKKELMLCEKYLKLDERNFHTWDYRRFVVAHSKAPLKDEFDFTTEKLHDNFSNYSAWHYRSKMLVELYPDLEAGRPIEDGHHRRELQLVQSAAFTDPDDTSAWFYQRWLLGAVKVSTQVVTCTLSPSKVTVAFNTCVQQQDVKEKLKVLVNVLPIEGVWISCTGQTDDCLWIYKTDFKITDGLDIQVEFEGGSEKQLVTCLQRGSSYFGKAQINFQRQYSKPVIEELNKQLESCRQLLAMEPDNRWTLLTTTVFLQCIDSKKHYDEVIANLHTLKILDKLRAGYYDDLITKWSIEYRLSNEYVQNDSVRINFGHKVATLPHLQYYSCYETVDLSNQKLTQRVLPSLVVLQHCKILNLENNNITSLRGFPNLQLKQLCLKGNTDLTDEEIAIFKKTHSFEVIF